MILRKKSNRPISKAALKFMQEAGLYDARGCVIMFFQPYFHFRPQYPLWPGGKLDPRDMVGYYTASFDQLTDTAVDALERAAAAENSRRRLARDA